jgi:diaminopropionate ammonia-lyase
MQGYLTLAEEIAAEIDVEQVVPPTHIFLQVGVGSFAAAMTAYFRAVWTGSCRVVLVEPKAAAPYFESIRRRSAAPVAIGGELATIMAGLSCGEANPLAWEVLKNLGYAFISCADPVAARGMRILGNPLPGDPRIISGESGAVGAGVVFSLCRDPRFAALKEALELSDKSRILLISTEGDTDPVMYRHIVWDGAYSYPTGDEEC